MQPDLSLIVPNRNHKHRLPRLLDSMLAQKHLRPETIIVDDCPDEGSGDLAEAYRSKGLNVRVLSLQERAYTKKARMFGVREAQADIIAFADADDTLCGDETLAAHTREFRENNADVLHFRTLIANADGVFERFYQVADPFAERLEGRDVFRGYLGTDLRGTIVMNKLYARRIWLPLAEAAMRGEVRHYGEDIFLCALYFAHATRYVGSHRTGYIYNYTPKLGTALIERAEAVQTTRQELLPLLREKGWDEDTLALFARQHAHYLSLLVGEFCLELLDRRTGDIAPERMEELLALRDAEKLLPLFVTGNALNANKLVRTARVIRGA